MASLPSINPPPAVFTAERKVALSPFKAARMPESVQDQALPKSAITAPSELTLPASGPKTEKPAAKSDPTASASSPFSPPTAKAAANPTLVPSLREQKLPATAEDGWRAAELAVARREIARLKLKSQQMEEQMSALRRQMDDLLSDPPAPDHRKVTVMLEQWMSVHLDSVVEQSVRQLFRRTEDGEALEEAPEPWFRQQPLVSMSHAAPFPEKTAQESPDSDSESHSS